MDDRNDDELMRRTRAAFDAETEALDVGTRQRLAAARRAALEELEGRQRHDARRPAWMPVAAAATVAVAAVGVALTVRGPQGVVRDAAVAPVAGAASNEGLVAGLGAEPASEMELLLDEDDLALYAEDPEFISWAAAETGAAGEADDAG